MPPSSPPVLLDGNVLVALAYPPHVQHPAARRWFLEHAGAFATCPITQGTLVRTLLNVGAVSRIEDALAVLRGFVEHPRHCFWQDSLDYLRVDMKGVIGHKQVTDAYLASLARSNGGRLATFDRGMAALHSEVVDLMT